MHSTTADLAISGKILEFGYTQLHPLLNSLTVNAVSMGTVLFSINYLHKTI